MTPGQLCIAAGWIFISMGITTGSILSAWSFAGPFKAPKGHTNYADLPRRLNRLAHIACFMLPLIGIVYGQHLDLLQISDTWKLAAAYSWLTCMVGVPLTLFCASFWTPFKYLAIIPVSAGSFSLYLISWENLKLFLN